LDIDGVQLLEDSQVVAEDNHSGRTGDGNVANVFHLRPASVKPGARYSIRASVRSAGGTDSNGTIYLRVIEPSSR
jgi:hexosaminidase